MHPPDDSEKLVRQNDVLSAMVKMNCPPERTGDNGTKGWRMDLMDVAGSVRARHANESRQSFLSVASTSALISAVSQPTARSPSG